LESFRGAVGVLFPEEEPVPVPVLAPPPVVDVLADVEVPLPADAAFVALSEPQPATAIIKANAANRVEF
jgi:hypothetical protein